MGKTWRFPLSDAILPQSLWCVKYIIAKNSPKHNRRIWLKITKFTDGFRRALGYDSHAPSGGEDGAMLLQCESEGRGDGPTTGWLRAGTLESLVELNELCLGLIAEQAAAHGATGSALLRQVGELWWGLDAPARL